MQEKGVTQMSRKLTRQRAMVEVIDSECPVGPWMSLTQAQALSAACEAVALLYERGGHLHGNGLGYSVKPERLKDAFLAELAAWRAPIAEAGGFADQEA
jgi:hypothetical protein